jgi:hypothetical protein
MKSRIKSIVEVFLTVGVAKVNICSFLVATLTLTAGDGHILIRIEKRKRK